MLARFRRLRPYWFDLVALLVVLGGGLLLGQTFAGRLANMKSGTLGDVLYSMVGPQIRSGIIFTENSSAFRPTCDLQWRHYDYPEAAMRFPGERDIKGLVLYGLADSPSGPVVAGASSSGKAVAEGWSIVDSAVHDYLKYRLSQKDATLSSAHGVAAGADDVWVAGSYGPEGAEQTLLSRWERYTIMRDLKVDHALDHPGVLYAISAGPPSEGNQFWAVGSSGPPSARRTLTEHYDGREWRVIDSPNMKGSNSLYGVAALSASDAWAVGSYVGSTDAVSHTLAMHWDGGQWGIVPGPEMGGVSGLNAVSVVSANDAWAVGSYLPGVGVEQTLVERWDGVKWAVFPSPQLKAASSLRSIAAIATNDVWVVGSSGTDALLEHWDGKNWTVYRDDTRPNAILTAVVAHAPNDVWATGYYQESGWNEPAPILMRYDYPGGDMFEPCPTATAPNMVTASATPVPTEEPPNPPTSIPTSLPTFLPAGTVAEPTSTIAEPTAMAGEPTGTATGGATAVPSSIPGKKLAATATEPAATAPPAVPTATGEPLSTPTGAATPTQTPGSTKKAPPKQTESATEQGATATEKPVSTPTGTATPSSLKK